MANFPKPLQDLSEEDLLDGINNHWSPNFGVLGSYELLRRLALQNSKSSRRFAWWSLWIAIVAIIISIILGFLQLSYIQKVRVINDPLQVDIVNQN